MKRWKIGRAEDLKEQLTNWAQLGARPSSFSEGEVAANRRERFVASLPPDLPVAVVGEGSLLRVTLPVIGKPRLGRDAEGRTTGWFGLSNSGAAFHVDALSTEDRQLLEGAASEASEGWVSIVRGRDPCEAEQVDLIDPRPTAIPNSQAPLTPVQTATLDRATVDAIFAELAGGNCDLEKTDDGCIPFGYPDFGCEARAHKGWQRLQKHKLFADKTFKAYCAREAYGRVDTLDHPQGFVCWIYHIAVAVRVIGRSGRTHTEILDPALFDRSERAETWRARVRQDTGESDYREVPARFVMPVGQAGGDWWVDDDLSWTDAYLADVRCYLRHRRGGA